MRLSPHFDASEFLHSDTAVSYGIDNSPDLDQLSNLTKVADVLEKVRALVGHPVNISSGFRCPELNARVGGVPNSAHMQGFAADINSPEFGSPKELFDFLTPHVPELGIDQLIYEHNGAGVTWVHVGLSSSQPRNEVLTIAA